MVRFSRFATLWILLLVLPAAAWAEPDPEKIRDIKRLLELSGIRDQLAYMKNSLLNNYSLIVSSAYGDVPDEFWNEYNDIIGEKEMEDLVDRIVPVYDRHMSHEVVRKLNAMFDTPFWNEWKIKMPLISREAGAVGSQWGQELIQSEAFTRKMELLIQKYHLENAAAPNPPTAEPPRP